MFSSILLRGTPLSARSPPIITACIFLSTFFSKRLVIFRRWISDIKNTVKGLLLLLLYKLKYAILIETGSLDGAWPSIEKAILLYPDYVDLYFYKGYILYKMKNYTEALQAFEKCLELGDHHTEHLILKGTGSFKAWKYKGLCLEQLGKMDEAHEAFRYEKNIKIN